MSFRYKNLKNSPRGEGYPYRVSNSLPRDASLAQGMGIPRWSRGLAGNTNNKDCPQIQGHEVQQGKLHCVLQKMALRRSQRRSKTAADKENSPSALRGARYRPGDVELYSKPASRSSGDSLSSLSSSVSDAYSSCELLCNESRDTVRFKKHTAQQQTNPADRRSQEQLFRRTLNAQSGECTRSGVDKEGKLPLQRIPLRSLIQRDFHESLQSDDDPVSL